MGRGLKREFICKESMDRVSIITINYNNAEGLRRTLESVAMQSCHDFEYVVIDGGSTDGSVEVIESYSDCIDKWVSEPDKGIYNAMNKGAAMASREYVMYLNSGDWLRSDDVMARIKIPDSADDIVFGRVEDVFPDGRRHVFSFDQEPTLMWLYRESVNHAGTFIRRDVQMRRPYNEHLRICSDRQFFIEALVLDNCSYSHIDDIICCFDKSGVSSRFDELLQQENECILEAAVPPRISADYRRSNARLQALTAELIQFQGAARWIVRIDRWLLGVYKFIRKVL